MGWEIGFSEGVEDLEEAIVWIVVAVLLGIVGMILSKIIGVLNQASFNVVAFEGTFNTLSTAGSLLSLLATVCGFAALLGGFCKAIEDWEYGLGRALALLIGMLLLPVITYPITLIIPNLGLGTEVTDLALFIFILLFGATFGFIVQTLRHLFS